MRGARAWAGVLMAAALLAACSAPGDGYSLASVGRIPGAVQGKGGQR